jgi:hypothetical protein
VAAVQQFDQLAALLNRKVVYLDAKGEPESLQTDGTQLPTNLPTYEKQLRTLRSIAKDDPQTQLRVWGRAVETAKSKGMQTVPVSLIQRTADDMVADGSLSRGLDAELEKRERAKKGQRATASSPLEFNIYVQRAEWRGHTFDVVSHRTADDSKVFEVHVDHQPVLGPDGGVVRFYTTESARKRLEERAEELEPDMWQEETTPPALPVKEAKAEKVSVPTPVAGGKATKAKKGAGKGSDTEVDWWIGTDKSGGSVRHEVFSHPKGQVPSEEETGYDDITGEFASQKEAERYIADGTIDQQ